MVAELRLAFGAEGFAYPSGLAFWTGVVRVAAIIVWALTVFSTVGRAEMAIVLSQTQIAQAATIGIGLAWLAKSGVVGDADLDRIWPSAIQRSTSELIGAGVSTGSRADPLTGSTNTEPRLALSVLLARVE